MFSGLKKTVSSLTSDDSNPKAKDPYAIGVENECAVGSGAVRGNFRAAGQQLRLHIRGGTDFMPQVSIDLGFSRAARPPHRSMMMIAK